MSEEVDVVPLDDVILSVDPCSVGPSFTVECVLFGKPCTLALWVNPQHGDARIMADGEGAEAITGVSVAGQDWV